MTLRAVVVQTAPDVIGIARRLSPRGGLAVLQRGPTRGGWRASYIAADPLESVSTLLPPPPEAPGNDRRDDTRAGAPRWIGAIPYEAGRRLERLAWSEQDHRPAAAISEPIWHRYGAVVEVDHQRGVVRVIGDDATRVTALARDLARGWGRAAAPASVRLLPTDDPAGAHLARVRAALELVRAGDLYQVNLARRLRFAVTGDPLELYAAMARHTSAPFGAYLDAGEVKMCVSSPELFLSLDADGAVRTGPIKGTRPRGADAREDRRQVLDLARSAKENAELTMILDVERNDLGRVAAVGSVRVLGAPVVVTHPTLHHRGATVAAQLAPGLTAVDLVRATFPSGSVTGAPKVRAMEVIAALEPVRRGLYTGALGAVGFDGSLRLAMAIRVLTVRAGEGHYHTGGGIVADSAPEAELEETRWKAVQVERLLTADDALGPHQ